MINNNTPDVRFAEFKEEWEERAWIDTVDISTNMVDPKTGEYDDLPHIGPGNIESFTGRILVNVKSVKEDNLISGKFHFNAGDIIYGKINPQLGKYILADFEGLASADAYILNAKNGLTQNFLFGILQRENFYKYSVSVSMRTGMPKINRDELNQYKFLMPTPPEQTKIGKFFKQLNDTIALHQQELTSLKQTKYGFLQKVFPKEGESVPEVRFQKFTGDWEPCKLSSLTNYKNGKGHEDKQSDSGKYELINLNSISIDGGLKHSGKFVDEASELLKKDDLVMVLSDVGHGDLLGRVALIPENNKFVLNQRVALLRPNENVNPLFLFSYINLHQNYFKSQGAGMSQLNISRGSVENFEIFVPGLEEQKTIGDFFKKLDDMIILHQSELESLKETKKAFLQKMFA